MTLYGRHDRKHFFSTIYSYRKSTWGRYWVNQSFSRIGARGSGGIMSLKVRTMVNRQTRSSRARRVPCPAATKSNRVANYKVHFQVSRLARGVQLENSISATDETSGPPIVPRTFFSPLTTRPLSGAILSREIVFAPLVTSRTRLLFRFLICARFDFRPAS